MPCLSRMIDSCPPASEAAHSLGICLSTELSSRGRGSLAGTVLPLLYVPSAKHVILRKLVGGETEIGSFTEVVVAWKIIYRISGK